MKISYHFKFSCVCPSDEERIEYSAELGTDKFILVEDIKSFVETLKNKKMFQEPLTELLAKKFSCRVVTFAVHQDVEVVCEIT
mgnify:FL=1|tara:strand:- start:1226 stop:1474 length:249 start_codon:yes stop_codon:yes gene_type:complete